MSEFTSRKYLDTGPRLERVRPVLSPTSTRAIACHIFAWFFSVFGVASVPFAILYVLLWSSSFKSQVIDIFGWFSIDSTAMGLMGVYIYMAMLFLVWAQLLFPAGFHLQQVRPTQSFRYHRTHVSHMRIDRFRRLTQAQPFTIFAQGFGKKSIPILVTSNMNVADIKNHPVHQQYVPAGLWDRIRTIVTVPGRFKPIPDEDTLASLAVGPLSHVQFRVLMPGGVPDEGDETIPVSGTSTKRRALQSNEDASTSAPAPQKRRKKDEPDLSLMLDTRRTRKIDKMQAALEFQRQPNNADDQTTSRSKPSGAGSSAGTSDLSSDSESVTIEHISRIITEIAGLTVLLPDSVPIGLPDGKIPSSFVEDAESPWEAFNRFFDRAFGEDTKDTNGRLQYISRGKHGMDSVNRYLASLSADQLVTMPLVAAHLKLVRLRDELSYLVSDLDDGITRERGSNGHAHSHKTLKKSRQVKDKEYKPPRHARELSVEEDAMEIFDVNGNEIVLGDEEIEEAGQAVIDREVIDIDSDGLDTSSGNRKGKEKMKKNGGSKCVDNTSDTSDGETALREVEEKEAARKGGRRGPMSDTLDYFSKPTRKNGTWVFSCKLCNSVRSVPATPSCASYYDECPRPSLSNFISHIRYHRKKGEIKEGKDDDEIPEEMGQGSRRVMEEFLEAGRENPGREPTYQGFLEVFSAWILEDDLAFTTGESSACKRVFDYLKIKFRLPSDTTVRKTLDSIVESLHSTVVREISMIFSFSGVIAHWIDDDWKLVERLVDFKHLESHEHAGEYAAKAFIQSASKRGGLNKMSLDHILAEDYYLMSLHFLAIVMDNASACDSMAKFLQELLNRRYEDLHVHVENSRIRCLAHVVNLIVQAMLKVLEEAESSDDVDYYLLHKDQPIHYDEDEDEELKAMEAEEDGQESDEESDESDDDDLTSDLKNARNLSALKRLRLITIKIVSSPQRRASFRKICKRVYPTQKNDKGTPLAKLMVIRDVRTRWNYTHAMIRRARLLRSAINEWVLKHEDLLDLRLSKEDWTELEQIEKLLEVFTEVTNLMSHADMPTLPFVLPMYRHMEKRLQALKKDKSLPPVFKTAIDAGLLKLKKYSDLAQTNQFYVIATVCHPTFRLNWFGKRLSDDYQQAKTLFEHIDESYAQAVPAGTNGVSPKKPKKTSGGDKLLESLWDDIPSDSEDENLPDIGGGSSNQKYDELEQYFSGEGGQGEMNKPLQWWKIHCKTTEDQRGFPIISRIARDFLAIPGTSVSVERLFSKSRHLCSDL
ncbi:hypothetical protein D9758_017443 [Tetrapyrgos nigripes]|uniref:HAT C-terminal dimerisation domain-containing protein n=1 Tax=Tetrapyrgos nigripes TaxID=182062 RepID=A0A8H5BZI6_9AGAR|nr:hypothetical protein D9758_017443 [Tetrapyrgos nigripes]